MELRRLAHAGQRAHASQERPDESALWAVHARRERPNHRLGLARAASELRVGRERVVGEALVVRYRAEQMRRVLRPAWQPEVDLGDRAVPVALEEGGELSLQERRQRARAVGRRELLGRSLRERGACGRVGAYASRERPQGEIHLGRRIEWEAAQDRPQLVLRRPSPEDAARRVVRDESRGDHRDEPRERASRPPEQESLEAVDPLARALDRSDAHAHELVDLPEQALACRVGTEQRAHDDRGRTRPHHGPCRTERRAHARSAGRRQPWIVQEADEEGHAARLHHRHHPGRQAAREPVAKHRGEVDEEPHAGCVDDGRPGHGIRGGRADQPRER